MELRNRIAHPSGSITWPSAEQAIQYLQYGETIAVALADICGVGVVPLEAEKTRLTLGFERTRASRASQPTLNSSIVPLA